MQNGTNGFLSRKQLVQMKIKAIRAGVWFKALPRIDRVLIDLTIKVADNIRSISLAKSILQSWVSWKGFWKAVSYNR